METATRLENPYLNKVLRLGGLSDLIVGSVSRFDLVGEYSWAIPNEEAIRRIAREEPIIEIGAGSGYWAWMLRQLSVDILAYDLIPPDGSSWPEDEKRNNDVEVGVNWYHRDHSTWTEVLQGGPRVVKQYPDRALMICWPPMSMMAYQCTQHYAGDTIIYIGEPEGGCTANIHFFRELLRSWDMVYTLDIPQWPGIHDYLEIYKRK